MISIRVTICLEKSKDANIKAEKKWLPKCVWVGCVHACGFYIYVLFSFVRGVPSHRSQITGSDHLCWGLSHYVASFWI